MTSSMFTPALENTGCNCFWKLPRRLRRSGFETGVLERPRGVVCLLFLKSLISLRSGFQKWFLPWTPPHSNSRHLIFRGYLLGRRCRIAERIYSNCGSVKKMSPASQHSNCVERDPAQTQSLSTWMTRGPGLSGRTAISVAQKRMGAAHSRLSLDRLEIRSYRRKARVQPRI